MNLCSSDCVEFRSTFTSHVILWEKKLTKTTRNEQNSPGSIQSDEENEQNNTPYSTLSRRSMTTELELPVYSNTGYNWDKVIII
ncbi:hypothetical protein SNE40_013374 [Patella caerulea]|uniref:Uncharacterized protein n=1 Tax=Patella caerulea TaxID=87958 RepID=A0AAN8PQN6_PATCE